MQQIHIQYKVLSTYSILYKTVTKNKTGMTLSFKELSSEDGH